MHSFSFCPARGAKKNRCTNAVQRPGSAGTAAAVLLRDSRNKAAVSGNSFSFQRIG